MSKYIHIRREEPFERLLKYKGQQLLVIQKDLETESWILVPGFVKNYKTGKTPRGLNISDILEVSKGLSEEIIEFVRKQGLAGKICFW